MRPARYAPENLGPKEMILGDAWRFNEAGALCAGKSLMDPKHRIS